MDININVDSDGNNLDGNSEQNSEETLNTSIEQPSIKESEPQNENENKGILSDLLEDVNNTTTRKKRKPLVPYTKEGTYYTGIRNAEKWETEPTYSLKHATLEEFKVDLSKFQKVALYSNSSSSEIKTDSNQLIELGKFFTIGVKTIKSGLKYIHATDDIKKFFPEMGFDSKGYLPAKRTKKAQALLQLSIGLEKHGLIDGKYGKTALDPLIKEYNDLIGNKLTTDGDGTMTIVSINDLQKKINKVQRSLVHLIKGNHPDGDDWEKEVRSWGFQREKN